MPRPVALLLLLPLLLAGCKKQNAFVAPPPAQVGVMHPLARAVTPSLDASGNTVAFDQVDLVARVQGFVQSIDYKDGSRVQHGDKLFVIEPAPYQAKLQQAQATLASSQANYTYQQAQYARLASLGRSDYASQSSVDQQKSQALSAEADIKNQTAAVALAGINLGYTAVTAPFDGTVTNHLVSVGELVGVTGPTKLATIVRLDPIYVTFNVSEQDVLRIRAELVKAGLQAADLHHVAVQVGLMTETGYPHAGTLDYAAPEVDPSSGTLMVRAVLPNPAHVLLPGYFVRIRVPMPHLAAQAMLVPDAALGSDQAGPYVLVVDKNNVVQQRPVKTGARDGRLRIITSGLTPEDQVIVTGLTRAIPGAKVAPSPAPPSDT